MHDLFLSYRRFEDKRVAPLVSALKARGITVWQDAHEIGDNASIQRAINEGLANARALLVWYSKDYNASRACQWELTTAYSAAQASGGDPRRRVLVVNPEASPGHIVLPELFDQLHLNAAALSAQDLAERIAARLADHAAGVPVEPLGSLRKLARPAWHGSAGLGSLRFVGRLREMWALHATLQAEQAAMLTGVGGAGRPGVLQVRGSGGMGKSLLAEEYALRFGAAYPGGVFWLRAYGYSDSDREMDPALREAQRDSQVRTIAMELGLDPHGLETPQVRGLLRRHFQGIGQPFLWVVDDLPPIERTDALAPWLAPHELGRTLITTRARLIESVKPIDLQQLEPDEALRLLTRGQALSDEDAATARAICAELGCHALAIDVTAALIRRRGYAKVLENLRQPDRDALEFAATQFREALPNGHERSIAATLLASLRELNEPARDLLRLASVLAAAPIPRDLQWRTIGLADGLGDDDAQDVADPAAAQLVDTSLADEAGAAGDGAFTVHTLVVRTVRFHDGRPERVEALRGAAVEVLLTKMPLVVDIRTHEALKDWVAHARQVSMEAQDARMATVLSWVGRHDHERGDYRLACDAFLREQNTRRQALGADHPTTLTAMHNLSQTLRAQGNFSEARYLAKQVLSARRHILGESHLDTIIAMEALGQVLQDSGDFSNARFLAEQALEMSRRTLGPDHSCTLTNMNNLATILQAQGNLIGARQLAEQVLSARRRILPKDHPHTLVTLGNLGQILQAQGDLDAARRCAEQVLEMSWRLLSNDNPNTITAMINLSTICFAQSDFGCARHWAGQGHGRSLHVFGEQHPTTTTAAWNLFQMLRKLQAVEEASSLFFSDLAWLLVQDPEQLGAAQRQIARMVRDVVGEANPG
ncbi:tetratricopeptide repeat protein [Sphaerotilus sp.]|uniref:tetratricopeptide repeat protein n=1 Tax=Sphaerotilus sp. TaxID=2093942 RepID=UPI0025DED1DA|nr:toll/interleukin-1 receptor domain-containing protein [Sphaerotilus sp.]